MTSTDLSISKSAPPPAPTAVRYWAKLNREYGQMVAAGLEPPIPRNDLVRIVDELEAWLAPASPRELQQAVQAVVGVYRKADLEAPEVYAAALLEDLAAFPLAVLRETARTVRQTFRFLPAISEILAIANRIDEPRRRPLLAARGMLDPRGSVAYRAPALDGMPGYVRQHPGAGG